MLCGACLRRLKVYSSCHRHNAAAFDSLRAENLKEDVMRKLFMLLIPMSIMAMSGCVVAPAGYHRGYYGPRVAVVAPAPVVVVRPTLTPQMTDAPTCGRVQIMRRHGDSSVPHRQCIHPEPRRVDRQSAVRIRERRRLRAPTPCRRWRGSSICRRPLSSCPPPRADARVRIFTPDLRNALRRPSDAGYARMFAARLSLAATRCAWKCRRA